MASLDAGEKTVFIDKDDPANCVGSQNYGIRIKAIQTEQIYESFMATLLQHDGKLYAVQRCQLGVVEFPLTSGFLIQ